MSSNSHTENDDFKVDISPEMRIYKILQHLNYNLETAFAEFVDNSIQSFIDKRTELSDIGGETTTRLNVCVEISTDKKQIIIKDNAAGISRADIERAFKLGIDIGTTHANESLSVYGIGMKSSAIWFTDDWSIYTSALGSKEKLTLDFNLNEFLARKTNLADVISDEANSSEHYTELVLRNHLRHETKSHYEDVIVPFIEETFHKFRSFVSIEFFYDGELIQANKKKVSVNIPEVMIYPPVDSKGCINSKQLVKWKIPLDFKYQERSVKGFILIRDVGSYGQPGLRLLRNNRVIEGTTSFPNIPAQLLKTKNKYAAQRIYGELHLDSFPVDFMKTNFNENLKGLYSELQRRISSDYAVDLLFQAEKFRVKVAKKEQSTFETINKSNEPKDVTELENIEPLKSEANTGKPTQSSFSGQKKPDNESQGSTSGSQSSNTSDGSEADTSDSNNESDKPTYEPFPDNRVEFSDSLSRALEKLQGNKPVHLYDSLCTLSLKKHSVLMYVGAWSFLEMLTSLIGRKSSASFPDFLGSKINEYTKDKNIRGELKRVVSDISTRGNCTKHSGIYWNHTAMDLKPAFIILEPFIIYLVDKYESDSKLMQ